MFKFIFLLSFHSPYSHVVHVEPICRTSFNNTYPTNFLQPAFLAFAYNPFSLYLYSYKHTPTHTHTHTHKQGYAYLYPCLSKAYTCFKQLHPPSSFPCSALHGHACRSHARFILIISAEQICFSPFPWLSVIPVQFICIYMCTYKRTASALYSVVWTKRTPS